MIPMIESPVCFDERHSALDSLEQRKRQPQGRRHPEAMGFRRTFVYRSRQLSLPDRVSRPRSRICNLGVEWDSTPTHSSGYDLPPIEVPANQPEGTAPVAFD